MGSDCKIMACRYKDEINLTISIPQLSTHVHSVSEYKKNYDTTLSIISLIIESSSFEKVTIILNPGDNTDKEMLYLRFTGSCIESGDEGQVSRGNRLGGVISSCRSFSIEGLSGKNPSYHAGKLYSVAAWDIAQKIVEQENVSCEVFITSQIDRPLDDPAFIVINFDYNRQVNVEAIQKIVRDRLVSLKEVTDNILDGKYPLV